jgi:hypothetical protein
MTFVINGYTISCNVNAGEIAVYHIDDMDWTPIYRGFGFVMRAVFACVCDMAREGKQIDLYRYEWDLAAQRVVARPIC